MMNYWSNFDWLQAAAQSRKEKKSQTWEVTGWEHEGQEKVAVKKILKSKKIEISHLDVFEKSRCIITSMRNIGYL